MPRPWAPHLGEAFGRLLIAAPLIAYEAHINAHGVPTTWLTLIIVGVLAGPVYKAGRALARERIVQAEPEQLLPEAQAALRFGPLMRKYGHVVLLEVEEAIRRRALEEAEAERPALTPGRRHADGE